ncbi:MAG TPA: hypothetical protein VI932_00995 [Bacteroidota bacterium]|nr:hypothetical protein [Bacteroidota bacterium]
MGRAISPLFLVLILLLSPVLHGGCKRPSERRREQARLDSLRRDSARPAYNPYKFGRGNTQYNRERENLGNIDSLVTPPNPAATTPRP